MQNLPHYVSVCLYVCMWQQKRDFIVYAMRYYARENEGQRRGSTKIRGSFLVRIIPATWWIYFLCCYFKVLMMYVQLEGDIMNNLLLFLMYDCCILFFLYDMVVQDV